MTRLEQLVKARRLIANGGCNYICSALWLAKGETTTVSDPYIMAGLQGHATVYSWLYFQLVPVYGREAAINLVDTHIRQARLAWLDKLISQC